MRLQKIWLALAVILGGCSATASRDDTSAFLAPHLRLDLPRPMEMGRSVEAVQMLTAHHQGKTYVFEAHLSITPDRVLLVGIDGMGQRIMTVTWRDNSVTMESSPQLPKEFQPGAMLADIAVLYWPESVMRKTLAAAGADLVVDDKSRSVSANGKEVLHAEYQSGSSQPWSGGLHYSNLAWGYDIDVVTVQVQQ
ncbi:DUF3261 domain-containing protein [Dongia soli]|uniref:DUF3261 domain-containing protein n=1 Tax=Dongia soli TaxID=600628 RepID=A0ABU5EFN1_9PROT|nr:DUF3261 domain-containing protein [Dongia soli]MDY0885220.1 DUF3261 domain-containing protein [Dongia soli]